LKSGPKAKAWSSDENETYRNAPNDVSGMTEQVTFWIVQGSPDKITDAVRKKQVY